MKTRLLTIVLLFLSLAGFSQTENPYAAFGYEGKVLTTPQERKQYMLKIPNVDSTSVVAVLGIETSTSTYYLFDKDDNILKSGDIPKELLAKFVSVDPKAKEMPGWSPYSFCFNSPLSFIDETGEIPSPVEGNKIAQNIYNGKVGDVVEGGWRLDQVFTSEKSASFKAGLYSRTVDGVTEFAMANAGTYEELLKSERGRAALKEDFLQPLGLSEDMKLSIQTAKQVSNAIGKKELTFVGHSKGGAEAAGNALATNRNALLYNPAGINEKAYGLDAQKYTGADENGMTAFVVKGELLDETSNKWLKAKPFGKLVYLPKQSDSMIENHGGEAIDKGLKAIGE